MNPTVSVLMSVYNAMPYLPQAIESILGQTVSQFEFIIVNDASTDESRDVILSYNDPRIRLLDNSENLGLTRSLNRGFQLVQGEFIARQDADDVSLPQRLEKQIGFLRENTDVALLGTSYQVINETGQILFTSHPPASDTEIRWTSLFHNAFCHTSVVFRKYVITEGEKPYNEEIRYAQDYELWSRILKKAHAANLGEPLVQNRTHPANISTQKSEDQKGLAFEISLANLRGLLGENLPREDEIERIREKFFGRDKSLNALDIPLCCTFLDIFDRFADTPEVNSEEIRYIRFHIAKRVLRTTPSHALPSLVRSGVLGRLLRGNSLRIIAGAFLGVWHRLIDRMRPKC